MNNPATQPPGEIGTVDHPVERPTGDMTIFDNSVFETVERIAEVMSKGVATVPIHLQGNKSDCMAVVMQAMQWRMMPFAVAQKTHLIGGALGYEAQLINAVINTMAPTKDRIHYDWTGDWSNVIGNFETKTNSNNRPYQVPAWTAEDEKTCAVRVWATLKGEHEPRELTLLLSQATVRNSTLWASDPKQQLAYLAVKRWSRLYTPDVIMGVYTPDEISERPLERNVTPQADDLNKSLLQDRIKEITGAINNAADIEALDVIAKIIKGESKAAQKELREIFNDRFDELKIYADQVPPDTDDLTAGIDSKKENVLKKMIANAQTLAALASAGEMISTSSKNIKDSLRDEYAEKLLELKAAEATPDPEVTKAFLVISEAISMAANNSHIDAIDKMGEWENLADGEVDILRRGIDEVRGTFGVSDD